MKKKFLVLLLVIASCLLVGFALYKNGTFTPSKVEKIIAGHLVSSMKGSAL